MDYRPDDGLISTYVALARSNVLSTVTKAGTARRSPTRRLGVVLAIGGGMVATVGAGAAVVQATQEQVSYSVNCYEKADLSAEFTTVAVPEAIDAETGQTERTIADPVALCGDMWRMGFLGQPAPPTDPNAANLPIPDLVACTESNGVGAGFPRGNPALPDEQFCGSVGLTVWLR